jgi:hypothetical protein
VDGARKQGKAQGRRREGEGVARKKARMRMRDVTPRVTKILIKLFKMQLSLKAREDQAVEVSNQNLNYQDFKFEVSKCYLVWTNMISRQKKN